MTNKRFIAATPQYVLLVGPEKMGPAVLLGDSCTRCVAIYGFSDKSPYDRFRENGDLSLRPYPLVAGYLKNQLSNDNGNESSCPRIVVLDASGPDEIFVRAASMQTVLESIVSRTPDVVAEYQLTLDQANGVYRLQKS